MAMSTGSLTYIPGFYVKFFFQLIYTDYANYAYFVLFVLYLKNYKIDVKFKLQTCSACQDLHTLQF